MTSRYNTQTRQPAILREFFAANPHLRLTQWDGIRLPAEGARASLAMAMAANMGPDIFENDIRQAVSQGLAHPLTEWIGRDGLLKDGTPKMKNGAPDLNGQIDADEAKWDGWMEIKPLYRQVVTVDGQAYALPNRGGTYVGILASKSRLRRAGLDPVNPPQTWDEFARWCRKLYDPKTKSFGVQLSPASWAFAPWVATTGSSIVVQTRYDKSGKAHTFNEQTTDFRLPNGEDLSNAKPTWRANVAGAPARAVGFFHRLRWQKWVSIDNEPTEVSDADIKKLQVLVDGKMRAFKAEDIVEGSIGLSADFMETIKLIGRGVAMFPIYSGDMTEFENLGLPPDDLTMMPFPAMTAAQKPVLQASNSFFLIGKDALARPNKNSSPEEKKRYRNAVWEIMRRICSVEGADEQIRQKVAAGQAKFLNPRDLQRLGLSDYLREISPENRRLWANAESGKTLEVIEPFMGRWLQWRDFYQREAIDLVLRPSGRDFNYQAALRQLERDANSGLLFERPKSALDEYRPRANGIAACLAVVMAFFTFMMVRDGAKKRVSNAGVYRGWLPWIMLFPALSSIALWGYYPLLRGLVMAFQDYKIVGASPFVGLDNFISIGLDPNFYGYIWTTFRFVLWNLALAFVAPIALAFLLSEVPKGKVFFRTLFFLPQMTSGLVVTLLWREMYNSNASGTLNRLVGAFGLAPFDWLGDPKTVMAAVVLPGVWAGAGIGSLIYLAALKSVPEELYEAAELDGAGILSKAIRITLPTLAPLILINFVGAFIGTFQSMGNIFLLTFGGPGKETMVMGMAIWQEAYVNLRFSLATSYAWILGSILIGFTYLQLRILRRVDFRRASEQ